MARRDFAAAWGGVFSSALVATALILIAHSPSAHGRLMAVDFGSENIRVSLVNSNRRPIQVEVVNNEISKRKTSAVVGFVNGQRLLGEAAAAVDGRYRDSIIARARDLLGKSASDSSLQQMLKTNYLPYDISDDVNSSSLRVTVAPNESYTAEELVASVLYYAHKISEQQFEGTFQDCVIVIPPFMGMRERQALYDAASLVGLNVISLIHAHSGAALQYGIERDFTNNTELVIFYDMGAGSVDVALAKFTSVNKAKRFQQFEVLDVAWDNTLGGSELDLILMEHFASEFEAAHKLDIRQHPKVMSKLRKAVKKTKEMLSANKQAPIYCEELHEGIDFSSSITREKFEELASDFFDRASKPLLKVLERNNLKPADVTNIELMGGGVRVPKLQDALQAALDGQQLSRHFTDPDEAVVLGSGLFAANFSSSFRLRPFGMVDCAPYGLSLEIVTEGKLEDSDDDSENDSAATATGSKENQPALKTISLLPFRKKLPIKRSVKLGRLMGDTVNMTLMYNASEALPPGVDDTLLGYFTISGISESIKKYNKTGKVTAHFSVGPSGMVTLDRAESVFEIVEYVEVEVPVKNEPKNETVGSNSTNSTSDDEASEQDPAETDKTETKSEEDTETASKDANAKEDTTDEESDDESEDTGKEPKKTVKKKKPAPEKPKMEKVKKQKKRLIHMPLKISGGLKFGLSDEQLKASKKRLKAIAAAEELKRATEAAKNELESFIINVGSIVSDEAIEQVSTEEEREKLSSEAMRLEDWLYEEGENEVVSTYRSKLAELKALVNPMQFRAKELEARPESVETVTSRLMELAEEVKVWEDERPWINSTDREALVESLEAVVTWLSKQQKEQESKKLYEDPVFTSHDVYAKFGDVEKSFLRLKAKKPPKPAVNKTIPQQNDTEKADEAEEVGEEGEGASSEGQESDDEAVDDSTDEQEADEYQDEGEDDSADDDETRHSEL